jgi:hypothetical protein
MHGSATEAYLSPLGEVRNDAQILVNHGERTGEAAFLNPPSLAFGATAFSAE